MKVVEEKRGGGFPFARGLCHFLQLSPLELGAVGTSVRVSDAAGAPSSPDIFTSFCIAPADPGCTTLTLIAILHRS